MARPKRKDKTRTVLRTGELQRSDGSYQYSWTDENHKRRYVYSKTLEALRIKEEAIEKEREEVNRTEMLRMLSEYAMNAEQLGELIKKSKEAPIVAICARTDKGETDEE